MEIAAKVQMRCGDTAPLRFFVFESSAIEQFVCRAFE
jgi:hypothetical protein